MDSQSERRPSPWVLYRRYFSPAHTQKPHGTKPMPWLPKLKCCVKTLTAPLRAAFFWHPFIEPFPSYEREG